MKGLFTRIVYALYFSAFFVFFAMFMNLIDIHSIDGLLTNMGIIWLFVTVVEEFYFISL